MSELWGTAIMSVLFWAFANEVMTVKDAKRFYGNPRNRSQYHLRCFAGHDYRFLSPDKHSIFPSFLEPTLGDKVWALSQPL